MKRRFIGFSPRILLEKIIQSLATSEILSRDSSPFMANWPALKTLFLSPLSFIRPSALSKNKKLEEKRKTNHPLERRWDRSTALPVANGTKRRGVFESHYTAAAINLSRRERTAYFLARLEDEIYEQRGLSVQMTPFPEERRDWHWLASLDFHLYIHYDVLIYY